jgi:hypothetical protein
MAALVQPPSILGIYIYTHGSLKTSMSSLGTSTSEFYQKIPSPEGLIVTKQNLGGFKCASYDHPSDMKSDAVEAVIRLTGDIMNHCMDHTTYKQDYMDFAHNAENTHGDPVVKVEKSCEQFTTPTTTHWVNKHYKYSDKHTPRIIINVAFVGRVLNLVGCTFQQLVDFIYGDIEHPPLDETSPQDKTPQGKINTIIIYIYDCMQKNVCSTNTLFYLSKLMQKLHGITHVNILDESCNIAFDYREKVAATHRGVPEHVYIPLPASALPDIDEQTGYGGTKRKKRKRLRKSKRIKFNKIY